MLGSLEHFYKMQLLVKYDQDNVPMYILLMDADEIVLDREREMYLIMPIANNLRSQTQR